METRQKGKRKTTKTKRYILFDHEEVEHTDILPGKGVAARAVDRHDPKRTKPKVDQTFSGINQK